MIPDNNHEITLSIYFDYLEDSGYETEELRGIRHWHNQINYLGVGNGPTTVGSIDSSYVGSYGNNNGFSNNNTVGGFGSHKVGDWNPYYWVGGD